MKIRSFTRGSGSTIPDKIYGNPAALTIDTSAEVSIVRKWLVRAEDVEPIPEMIKLKTVTGESTPIVGEASVEFQTYGTLVASMKDDFILGMDLISRHGLTIDPVRKVLRLGNEEFKLNQRCIEAKPARLTAYQNCKHYGEVEQPKAQFIQPQEESSSRRWWMDYSSVQKGPGGRRGNWAAPQMESRWNKKT